MNWRERERRGRWERGGGRRYVEWRGCIHVDAGMIDVIEEDEERNEQRIDDEREREMEIRIYVISVSMDVKRRDE